MTPWPTGSGSFSVIDGPTLSMSPAGDKLQEMFELFMDIDTIPPGVDFTDYVRRAVTSCDVLLAFIGDHWLS
jgi:hypothetical protein